MGCLMKKFLIPFCATLLVFCLSKTVNASLWDRGRGLIYDDDLNVIWLSDANFAYTSGYITPEGRDVTITNGRMTWDEANEWALHLVYQGYNNWRLPTTPGTVLGFAHEGEMGHLYYDELGGEEGPSILSSPDPDLSKFINLEDSYGFFAGLYWTGSAGTGDYSDWHFRFGIHGGSQDIDSDWNPFFAWAVRDGDVAPVPIPSAVLLLGSGLIGLIGLRRKS